MQRAAIHFATLLLCGQAPLRALATCIASTESSYDNMVSLHSDLELHWKVDSTQWSGRLIYSGSAWIAIGRSSDGYMIGADTILGLPAANTVHLYELTAKSTSGIEKMSSQSTLTSGSISQAGSTTTMDFVILLDQSSLSVSESGSQKFIYAYGSSNSLGYHAQRGSFSLDLTTCSMSKVKTEELSTRTVLAHGCLMLLAWAWIFPSGIISAFFKFKIGNMWMNMHMGIQILGALVVFTAICIMSITIDTTSGATHMNGNHPTYGIIVLSLMMIQILGGFARPHKVPGDMSDYRSVRDWVWKRQSPKRKLFQYLHKVLGYAAMIMAFIALLTGVHTAEDYGYISTTDATLLYTFLCIPLIVLLGGTIVYNYLANKKDSIDPNLIEMHNKDGKEDSNVKHLQT